MSRVSRNSLNAKATAKVARSLLVILAGREIGAVARWRIVTIMATSTRARAPHAVSCSALAIVLWTAAMTGASPASAEEAGPSARGLENPVVAPASEPLPAKSGNAPAEEPSPPAAQPKKAPPPSTDADDPDAYILYARRVGPRAAGRVEFGAT
jgi:hypothetical protein